MIRTLSGDEVSRGAFDAETRKEPAPSAQTRRATARFGVQTEGPPILASEAKAEPDKKSRGLGKGTLDAMLLRRAIELVQAYPSDQYEAALVSGALRGITFELWESASTASRIHQGILASIERTLLAKDTLSTCESTAILEGLRDLKLDTLSPSNLEVLRSRLVDAGATPMAILSDLSRDEDTEH